MRTNAFDKAGLRSTVVIVAATVMAEGAWAEGPRARCGSIAAFQRTAQIEDLPGCEGRAERPSRDPFEQHQAAARQALLRAQRLLDAESADGLADVLGRVSEAIAGLEAHARSGRQGSDGAEQVLAYYRQAATQIFARAQLLPVLDELRSCNAHAQRLLRAQREAAEPPGAADAASARAVARRADECLTLLRRLMPQHPAQDAPGAGPVVELAPGQRRGLPELMQDVRAAHKLAFEQQAQAQRESQVVRARWLRVLFGDRRKVFESHPDDLPDYDGKARGPLPASVVPRWRYRLPDGKVEVFIFNRSRLIKRFVEDMRRS